MKCSNCGEEVREEQRFCLKCGAPLVKDPAFSEIEKELADSVDSMILEEEKEKNEDVFSLDEDEEPDNEFNFDDLEIRQEFSLNEVEMAVNANRQREEEKNRQDIDKKKRMAQLRKQRLLRAKQAEEERRQRKKKRTIKALLITLVVLVLAGGAGAAGYAYYQKSQKDKGDELSQEYYVRGSSYYENGSYAAALREFLSADQEAVTDKQKEKVKYIIWQTYVNMGNREEDICQVLRELIELNSYEIEYYQALIEMYQTLGDSTAMEALFESIEDEDIYNSLLEYRSQIPTVNYEDGDYNQAISLEITAAEGSTIYYTLKKDKEPLNPTTSSQVYSEPITLDEEGTWYLKVIAKSSGGSVSSVVSKIYTLDFGIPDAPVVTPEQGSYTGVTQITVESPSEVTVYYTIDGEKPTQEDNVYGGPFDMTWGNHTYKFAAINEAGYSSTVVTVIYICSVEQNYDYDDALICLKSFLVAEEIMENPEGTFSDGSSMNFSYEETQIIDSRGYYVIRMTYNDSEGKKLTQMDYAVEFATGAIVLFKTDSEGNYEVDQVLKDPSGIYN